MNRDVILEAAAQIFSQKGYHGASMQDIAEAVNLQKASLYYHIHSKQELLVKPKAKRIPGAFFGFGPQEPEAPEVEAAPEKPLVPAAEPEALVVKETAVAERPKKRRKRRRKKRSPAAETGAPPNSGVPPITSESPLADDSAEPAERVIDSADSIL